MIHGKIISIQAEIEGHWTLKLDGYRKSFDTFGSIGVYLRKCLDFGKDKAKVKLLQHDYDLLFEKEERL